MSTAYAPLSIVGVRHQSSCFELRDAPRVGRAWRGAGAERPVQNQATPAVFNTPPVHSALMEQAPQHTAKASSWPVHRAALRAERVYGLGNFTVRPALSNHAEHQCRISALVAPRLRSTVRPNPSVNLTRYGRPCKPGLSQSYYRLSPGLQVLPPRAGYLER
jgi:hypothetical protein